MPAKAGIQAQGRFDTSGLCRPLDSPRGNDGRRYECIESALGQPDAG
jgi:hypothetical protein